MSASRKIILKRNPTINAVSAAPVGSFLQDDTKMRQDIDLVEPVLDLSPYPGEIQDLWSKLPRRCRAFERHLTEKEARKGIGATWLWPKTHPEWPEVPGIGLNPKQRLTYITIDCDHDDIERWTKLRPRAHGDGKHRGIMGLDDGLPLADRQAKGGKYGPAKAKAKNRAAIADAFWRLITAGAGVTPTQIAVAEAAGVTSKPPAARAAPESMARMLSVQFSKGGNMAKTVTRANSRRAVLRNRLDARYPLFAEQFYARDLDRHRAYYRGQPVAAPSHPRRRRPARRPIDRKAQDAFRARQLSLLAWRRPIGLRTIVRAAGRALRRILGKIGPTSIWRMSTQSKADKAIPSARTWRSTRSGPSPTTSGCDRAIR